MIRCIAYYIFGNKMKISIITINYNNDIGLRQTLDSVAIQTCTDFEHIIVDGSSTDASVEIIRTYGQLPIANRRKIKWISEPDTGIYNAMNKGVRMACGEYILMLNSGDYLVNEFVISRMLPILDGIDIIQGNTLSLINNVQYLNRGYGKSDISFIEVYQGYFLHQATFAKRELFERFGYFDENYKIGGDTVFYLKTLGFGDASFKYIDMNIAWYDMDGVSASTDTKWMRQRRKEDEMYDALLSPRLLKLCKEDGPKIKAYDEITKYWLLRKLLSAMLLLTRWLEKKHGAS